MMVFGSCSLRHQCTEQCVHVTAHVCASALTWLLQATACLLSTPSTPVQPHCTLQHTYVCVAAECIAAVTSGSIEEGHEHATLVPLLSCSFVFVVCLPLVPTAAAALAAAVLFCLCR